MNRYERSGTTSPICVRRKTSIDAAGGARGHIAGEFRAGFGVSVTLDTRGDSATVLRPEALNHLRQITRESLTNAIRHGGASRIRIIIDAQPSEVSVTVTDDGAGFRWRRPNRPPAKGCATCGRGPS